MGIVCYKGGKYFTHSQKRTCTFVTCFCTHFRFCNLLAVSTFSEMCHITWEDLFAELRAAPGLRHSGPLWGRKEASQFPCRPLCPPRFLKKSMIGNFHSQKRGVSILMTFPFLFQPHMLHNPTAAMSSLAFMICFWKDYHNSTHGLRHLGLYHSVMAWNFHWLIVARETTTTQL